MLFRCLNLIKPSVNISQLNTKKSRLADFQKESSYISGFILPPKDGKEFIFLFRTGLSILWQRVRRLASESLSALSLPTSHSTFQLFLQNPWCDVLPRWTLSCLKYFDKQHLLLQYQLDVKCLYAQSCLCFAHIATYFTLKIFRRNIFYFRKRNFVRLFKTA